MAALHCGSSFISNFATMWLLSFVVTAIYYWPIQSIYLSCTRLKAIRIPQAVSSGTQTDKCWTLLHLGMANRLLVCVHGQRWCMRSTCSVRTGQPNACFSYLPATFAELRGHPLMNRLLVQEMEHLFWYEFVAQALEGTADTGKQ